MKKLFTIIAGFLPLATFAQTWIADSVQTGAGYTNRVFYSLENGQQASVPFNTTDFLVAVNTPYSASIRINGGFNAALYSFSGDTTDWATLDTAGIFTNTNWTRAWDTEDYWELSAFEQGATGHPDYGWGTYNSITHDVVGTKLFAYKTVTGVWKKIWIKKLSAMTSAFTILTADVDGQNEETITISKAGVSGKNFIYYSFSQDSLMNAEPDANTYDLVFTKNVGFYGLIPNQAVTAVEINRNVLIAKVENEHVDDVEWTDYSLEEKLDAIGANWKYLDPGFAWQVHDSLSYFIQDQSESIWQLRFIKFVGAGAGKYVFEKRQMSLVSVEENEAVVAGFNVYPNPSAAIVNVIYTMKNADNASVTLTDLGGKTVYSRSLPAAAGMNNHVIDVKGLGIAPGVYVLRFDVAGSSNVQKLIVQ